MSTQKLKQTLLLSFEIFPPKNFINFLLKLLVQKVWFVQVKNLWEETMLHWLQVAIDLHKSKLYVKTKQKFSKDINSFASKVGKRYNSRNKWWVETLLRKRRSKYTNPEGKVSHLTCILIEGTFPSTNQHPCTFCCFKRPSTHMQDALENVFAQREIIFTHRLTLDEGNSCPSRPTVLYV